MFIAGEEPSHLLFTGHELRAAGDLLAVALALRETGNAPALVFEADTGRQIDLNVSGTPADVRRRYGGVADGESVAQAPDKPGKRGRPRLGVRGREVTLLPRHWEWLDQQRGGASAALRRLVDQARERNRDADRIRQAQDRTNRFLSAIAGDLPGFEEATRALYGGDQARFATEIGSWPADVRRWAAALSREAFGDG